MRVWVMLSALAMSSCATAPDRIATSHLGVGTPGVSNYMAAGEDDSLAAQLRRCGAAVDGGLAAACAQLRSTMRNQPGNVVDTATTR